MNKQLAQYRSEFEEASGRVRFLTSDLTDDFFNQRPEPGIWAVGEIVDHLCVIGNLMLPRIDVGIEEAKARGWKSDGPFEYPFLSRLFIRMVGPLSPSKRGKARSPKIYLPRPSQQMEILIPRFQELQANLIKRCNAANGLDIGRVSVPSPVSSILRVRLGAWLEALAAHQLRHFDQIELVRGNLGLDSTPKYDARSYETTVPVFERQ